MYMCNVIYYIVYLINCSMCKEVNIYRIYLTLITVLCTCDRPYSLMVQVYKCHNNYCYTYLLLTCIQVLFCAYSICCTCIAICISIHNIVHRQAHNYIYTTVLLLIYLADEAIPNQY